ncbi:hypothetical protein [Nostoc sp.]|uniref:hypothetical protein n=1 Tax=Nostoc sp. TaxID=1180 RepID=UPI002FF48BAF
MALSRKVVLLTRNHRDLGKIAGLLIEVVTVSCDTEQPVADIAKTIYFLCISHIILKYTVTFCKVWANHISTSKI